MEDHACSLQSVNNGHRLPPRLLDMRACFPHKHCVVTAAVRSRCKKHLIKHLENSCYQNHQIHSNANSSEEHSETIFDINNMLYIKGCV